MPRKTRENLNFQTR